MATNQAPTKKGREAAAGLRRSATKEERKVEAQTGHDMAKGEKRFEQLSKSSDGRSAGTKQK